MTGSNRTRRRVLNPGVLLVCTLALLSHPAPELAGVGTTSSYPIHAKWDQAFRAKVGVAASYQIGSGGGIRPIQSKTIDFGASDRPSNVADQERSDLMPIPMVVGDVVSL
jgi:phosphate transport system substrate-binding protein